MSSFFHEKLNGISALPQPLRFSLNAVILLMMTIGIGLFVCVSVYRQEQLTEKKESTQSAHHRVVVQQSEPFFRTPAQPDEISEAWQKLLQFPDGAQLMTEPLPLNFAIYQQNTLLFSSNVPNKSTYELQRKLTGLAPFIFIVSPSKPDELFQLSDVLKLVDTAKPVDPEKKEKPADKKLPAFTTLGPFNEAYSITEIEIIGESLSCVFKHTQTGKEISVTVPVTPPSDAPPAEAFSAGTFAALETELSKHSEYHGLVKISDIVPAVPDPTSEKK